MMSAIKGLHYCSGLLEYKLTVATGSLSGGLVCIPTLSEAIVSQSPALSVYSVEWLNLDFGIETCFYDGMEPFSKTCL